MLKISWSYGEVNMWVLSCIADDGIEYTFVEEERRSIGKQFREKSKYNYRSYPRIRSR